MKKYGKNFGKKEKVLNYASNNYQLTRPSKVDAVMALIRECQPQTIEEWEKYYIEKAYTKTKEKIKITKETLDELGERLYTKITEVVIPEWSAAFKDLTLQDCKDYIYEMTIVRTYDGFLLEKSIIEDGLAKHFPEVVFEESDAELDHVTANANFGNYKISERMNMSFDNFEKKHGGKVFIVFSARVGNKKEVVNKKVISEIKEEIKRLRV